MLYHYDISLIILCIEKLMKEKLYSVLKKKLYVHIDFLLVYSLYVNLTYILFNVYSQKNSTQKYYFLNLLLQRSKTT